MQWNFTFYILVRARKLQNKVQTFLKKEKKLKKLLNKK